MNIEDCIAAPEVLYFRTDKTSVRTVVSSTAACIAAPEVLYFRTDKTSVRTVISSTAAPVTTVR